MEEKTWEGEQETATMEDMERGGNRQRRDKGENMGEQETVIMEDRERREDSKKTYGAPEIFWLGESKNCPYFT